MYGNVHMTSPDLPTDVLTLHGSSPDEDPVMTSHSQASRCYKRGAHWVKSGVGWGTTTTTTAAIMV
ncbi:hypothetical protein EYF80_040098 [Liparis tanakae]|uniref:Uncharacterized protein n=1 Tax=Liparis tanakae TaxID=230148 RepID=A0A4Z2G9S6_9TELE|nr:hypothetical protein EYF80_040098 [Liparis tanakae]